MKITIDSATLLKPTAHVQMPDSNRRLLRRREVERLVGLSRSAIYRRLAESPPTFPMPVAIGPGAVRWREADVMAWIDTRPPVERNA